MAQFYASIQGQAKTEATRRGGKTSGISGHIRGWHQGVEVRGYVDMDGKECFEVYVTGGSSPSTSPRCIGLLKEGQFISN